MKKILKIIIIIESIIIICTLFNLIIKKTAYKYEEQDVKLLLSYLNGEIILPNNLQEIYDVKRDGELNVLDVVKMINIINQRNGKYE